MKKTWKRWLGTVATALVTSTALAQGPDDAGVVTMRGQSPTYSEEGSVRTGQASASATGNGIRQTQYGPSVDPGDVFEDAVLDRGPGGYYAENGGVGFASPSRINDIQWRVGNQSLDALGYNGGYTNINAFVPLSTDGYRSILFFNPRVDMNSTGNGGVNMGLGYRFFDPADDRVYGASGWWDYDAMHRSTYSQMGVSLESLGRFFSARFNASLPLNDYKDFQVANPFGSQFFQGNNIAYQFNFLRETSYQNYQLEIATPMPLIGRYGAEWALSGYGLVANSPNAPDAMGIAGRFEVQVSEDFWINTIVSNDRIFGTRTSINCELTIPNGMQKRWLRPSLVRDRLMASVKRSYRVNAAIKADHDTRYFLDPKDGSRILVAHIDPTAANGAATGSVLNPFGSVQDYMNLSAAARSPFDIVYVGRNADGSDTDLNTSIELLNCQRLLGTGALADGSVHQFRTVDRGDGLTVFNLPGFANSTAQSTGANPFLSNSGNPLAPVVRLNGNFTEVTGFKIDASGTAAGIASVNSALAPRSVDSFVITNNTIQDATTAINIRSNTTAAPLGPSTMPDARTGGFVDNIGIIANNVIDGTAGTAPLVGVANGINVTQVAGTGASALNLSVRNNTLTSVGTDLDADGILDTGTAITVTANAGTEILANTSDVTPFTGILDNTITNSGSGVLMTALAGSHIQLDVLRNTVTGSSDATGSGMTYNATGGLIGVDVFGNNSVTGGAGLGVVFNATAGGDFNFVDPVAIDPITHPVADSVFHDNTITGNALTGLTVAATGAGSTINIADMTTNTISANGGSGIDASALAGAVVAVGPMTGNTIANNTLDGITGTTDGAGSQLTLQIGSADTALALNTITGNGANGINLTSTNGALLTAPIIRNTITGNTLDGVNFTLNNTTQNAIDIEGNTISDNGNDGVEINSTDTTINDILIDANFIDRNVTGNGILFQSVNSVVTNQLQITNNSVSNNALNGIKLATDSTTINDLVISDNNQGLQLAGGTLDVDFTNLIWTTFIDNNSSAGFDIDSITLNIAPVGQVWRPDQTPFNNQFEVTGLSDVTVGLQSINGVPVVAGTVPFPLPNGGVPLNSNVLTFNFNDFNPGEQFDYELAHSLPGGGIIGGNTLAGSTMTVTLADGRSATGTFAGGFFNVTRVFAPSFAGISSNGLDGICIAPVNGSTITTMTVDNNLIQQNARYGLNVAPVNSNIGTPVNPAVITSNTISNNTQGGAHFEASQTSDINLLIGGTDPALGNTITGNGDFNIDVDLAGVSTGNVVVQNNTITNAVNGPNVDFAGDGVVFRTTDNTRLYNAQVLDNTITGNAGDGLRVLANAASQIHATGDPTSPGLLVTGNTISTNGDDGIQIQRQGDAIIRSIIGTTGGVGVDPLLGNTISGNTSHGINILTEGGSTAAGVSTDVTIGQNTISGNGLNGVNVVTNDDSQTRVDLISNLIQGLGTQDNGVSVITNNASVFGVFGGASSLFDGNVITGNAADGVVLRTNNISQLSVDLFGDTQQSVITGNGANGVSVIDTSAGGLMNVNIGDPATTGVGSIGADVAPDAANVVIGQNGNDAIRVSQAGAATINLAVNNTLATGNRSTGAASRNGLSYNADNEITSGTANITVDNSTFVDFGGDGMHIFYNHSTDPFGTRLNVNVTDSIIGQTQFSTNVGDGVDIEVRDNGARFNFDNNIIQNNGGDGFRIVTNAESMNTARIGVFPNLDVNASGQNETTTPANAGLPGTLWADPNFVDFTTRLSLTNNLVRFNGDDGVDLAIGAGTRLGTAGNRAIVRGNTMSGNANFGFQTRTITNALVAPPTDSVQNGENAVDIVRLDPMAFLFLAFGDNATPNTTTQLNPTVTGGVIAAADAIKASGNRAIITQFDVNTNDLNNSSVGGVPVSTLNTFFFGWQFPQTATNGTGGGAVIAPINTGNVNNVP